MWGECDLGDYAIITLGQDDIILHNQPEQEVGFADKACWQPSLHRGVLFIASSRLQSLAAVCGHESDS